MKNRVIKPNTGFFLLSMLSSVNENSTFIGARIPILHKTQRAHSANHAYKSAIGSRCYTVFSFFLKQGIQINFEVKWNVWTAIQWEITCSRCGYEKPRQVQAVSRKTYSNFTRWIVLMLCIAFILMACLLEWIKYM